MLGEDAIVKIMAAIIPVILAAMGYQFQVIRGIQKQLDRCIDRLSKE